MLRLFVFGCAGFLGAVSRCLVGDWAHQWLGREFPYGTLIVNVTGCFAVGFLGTLADERSLLNSQVRFVLLFGFFGAYTTFSSFTYETWVLFKNGQSFLAGCYVLGGFLACFMGLAGGVLAAKSLLVVPKML